VSSPSKLAVETWRRAVGEAGDLGSVSKLRSAGDQDVIGDDHAIRERATAQLRRFPKTDGDRRAVCLSSGVQPQSDERASAEIEAVAARHVA
jgi:hypothetical protein